jgi:hypothetical protein
VRVVAWNMNHWQTKSRSEEAWRYLLEELHPDVALLTEASPPAAIVQDARVVFAEVPGRDWGSAVYVADDLELRLLPIEVVSHPGAFVVVEIDSPELSAPITAISLYGLFEKILKTDYSSPSLHRSLSDLTVVLDDPTRRGRIILGGDLNVSPLKWGPLHRVIFDRIELFGLESCLDYRERPTPTHRQVEIDYVFVSRELVPRVSAGSVVDVGDLSDHRALVVEIELAAAR